MTKVEKKLNFADMHGKEIGDFTIASMSTRKEGHNAIHSVSNFYIRRLTATGGGMMPPARTSIHCFFFLKSGNVEINVAERTIVIEENSCLIVPMGQVFSVTKCSAGAEGYMGGFHTDFLINETSDKKQLSFLYGWLSNPIPFSGKRLFYINNIFERIYDEWTSEEKDLAIIKTYMQALIQELGNQQKPFSGSENKVATKAITETFMQLLSDSSFIKVDQFASKMNITLGHLSKCIKETTGKSPFKWIEEKIMTEAKMFLYQTDLPIGEIAEKIGITDVSYFSRVFKKNVGVTPNEFRKMINQK